MAVSALAQTGLWLNWPLSQVVSDVKGIAVALLHSQISSALHPTPDTPPLIKALMNGSPSKAATLWKYPLVFLTFSQTLPKKILDLAFYISSATLLGLAPALSPDPNILPTYQITFINFLVPFFKILFVNILLSLYFN